MADVTADRDGNRAGYTVGLTASLPLYDAGERRAGVDGAKARVQRAEADAQSVRQDVESQVAKAWLNMPDRGRPGRRRNDRRDGLPTSLRARRLAV